MSDTQNLDLRIHEQDLVAPPESMIGDLEDLHAPGDASTFTVSAGLSLAVSVALTT